MKMEDSEGWKLYSTSNLKKDTPPVDRPTGRAAYLKCVLRLSCVVHGPIYIRFMGFYVNGFLSL